MDNGKSLETRVRQVLLEVLSAGQHSGSGSCPGTVRAVNVPAVRVTEQDRMDTGKAGDQVYTHDLLTLKESPRLGCGVMEMRESVFPWTLRYDEVDVVLEGRLEVIQDGRTVSAGPGELIYIPKDSSIQFSAPRFARFLYVTYAADWQNQ